MHDREEAFIPASPSIQRVVGSLQTPPSTQSHHESVGADADRCADRFRPTPVVNNAVVSLAKSHIKEAAQLLLYSDVHRVFVVNGDKLVGVLSSTDILRAVANGQV